MRLVSHFGRRFFTDAIRICACALHSTPELKIICPSMPVVATGLHHDVKHAGPKKGPRTKSLCPGCGTKTRSKKWHPKLGHYLASKLAPPSTLYVGGWLSCVWGCRCMGVRRANLCVSPVPVKAPRSRRKNPKNVQFCGPVLGARKWHRFWGRFI